MSAHQWQGGPHESGERIQLCDSDWQSDCLTSHCTAIAGHENDAVWIKGHFSELVEEIRKSAGESAIIGVSSPSMSADANATQTLRAVADRFSVLDKFYLGLAQG
jgi:hypothetical protein